MRISYLWTLFRGDKFNLKISVFAPLKPADLTAKTWEVLINFMFQIKHKTEWKRSVVQV